MDDNPNPISPNKTCPFSSPIRGEKEDERWGLMEMFAPPLVPPEWVVRAGAQFPMSFPPFLNNRLQPTISECSLWVSPNATT